jgi:biopolymer transport protein ExbB/TolQ
MLGLLGTVIGMMGAFATLATAETVDATQLADDINVALRTTAAGLAIAIPLVIAMAAVNVRIRKMEDLVAAGLTRFLDSYRAALGSQAAVEK